MGVVGASVNRHRRGTFPWFCCTALRKRDLDSLSGDRNAVNDWCAVGGIERGRVGHTDSRRSRVHQRADTPASVIVMIGRPDTSPVTVTSRPVACGVEASGPLKRIEDDASAAPLSGVWRQ